jgi:hypothetical protein
MSHSDDPFAAAPVMPSSEQACPRCGAPMDPSRAGYSETGIQVCRACLASEQITVAEPEQKPVNVLYGSFGSLLIATTSFCVQHRLVFFLLPLLAIGGGVGSLLQTIRDERTRQALGWMRIPSMIASGLAIALGLSSLLLSIAFF